MAAETIGRKYNRDQAGDYLGVPPATLADWACRGTGPAYHKVGRRVWYLERDLVEFFTRGRVEPADRTDR